MTLKEPIRLLIARMSYIGFSLGLIAISLVIVAGAFNRFQVWHFSTSLMLFRWAVWIGFTAGILSLVGILFSRARRKFVLALCGLIIGGVLSVKGIYQQRTAKAVPRIHDISTDTQNPPEFQAILPLRKDAPNSAVYGGQEIAEKQLQAYPDIQTKTLRLPAPEAFAKALETAKSMGWQIVENDPASGRIEATDTTFWMGFKDDVVIRIQAAGNESKLDIRSVSRVGLSDVGANARRIRNYFAELDERL